MAAPLPRDRQLRLTQTLGQWRHWDCDPPLPEAPSQVAALGPGYSNDSYRVQCSDGRAFVVRLDGVQPASHGISRQAEWHALHSASAQGLAPQPRYFNPDLGALVCDYLPPDTQQRGNLADIASLLRGIHNLPPLHHRLDLGERVNRYRRQLAHTAPATLPELGHLDHAVDRALAWQREQPVTCLCHNDLLAANRLRSGGRLWALDWEYCAMGSPWFDLAAVCCGDELGLADTTSLLSAYLGRQPDGGDWRLLGTYGLIYRAIELLWFAGASPGSVVWPAKLARLEAAAENLQLPD